MRVMVTGGSGFIGRYVIARLEELGCETYVYDRSLGRSFDVLDLDHLLGYVGVLQPDAIIHLAGVLGTNELWDSTDRAIDVNIKGGLNVGRAALEVGAKLVSIEQPHIWYNVYEATKLALRRMLTGLHYDQGLQVDFVTAHNAFGAGQAHGAGHPVKIVPAFSTAAWQGEPIEIWGSGYQRVNLIHAADVADALVGRAVVRASRPHHEFQAGTNKLMDVIDVANLIREYVADNGEQQVPITHKSMRRGEQSLVFDYPKPTEDYLYEFRVEDLYSTIESYRP